MKNNTYVRLFNDVLTALVAKMFILIAFYNIVLYSILNDRVLSSFILGTFYNRYILNYISYLVIKE